MLDQLTALVNKSLVQSVVNVEEPRFTLLETICEYALEQLVVQNEYEATQQRHRDYYLALAEAAEPALKGPQQGLWFTRLAQEFNNLQAVVHWAFDHQDMATLARLAGALHIFCISRGHWREVRGWLATALADPATLAPAVRVKALSYAGSTVHYQRDYSQALALLQEALALARTLEDPTWTIKTLRRLGDVLAQSYDYAQAARCYDESLALARAVAYHEETAATLANQGVSMENRGDYTRHNTL